MNPPAGSQRIVPYLYYDDPRAALEHLCRVFGFEQTMLLEWPDGCQPTRCVALMRMTTPGMASSIGYRSSCQ